MKKILSIIIVLSFILTPSCLASTYDEVLPSFDKEINELKIIGIIDENFLPDELMTRGEFAHLLVKMAGLYDLGLRGDNIYFYDVPKDHKHFHEITYCAEKGYVNGYADGLFRPESNITTEQALKVLVHFLGYNYLADISGGFSAGYTQTAINIGLTKGIDLPYGENLLGSEVAKLIHNAIDIPLVILTGINGDSERYEISEDKTVLSENFDIGRVSGVVYATDITGISGYSKVSQGYAVIDGVEIYSQTGMARDFLGYNVDALYVVDEITGRYDLLSIQINEDNKVIELTKEDFKAIKDGKFYYDTEVEEKTVTVTRFFEFVYNGENAIFDSSLISNAKYGRFTLISNDRTNNYGVVIFNSYSTLYVERIADAENILYDSEKTGSGFLKLDYDNKVVNIKDAKGNNVDFGSIKLGDVLTYYVNSESIVGYISDKKITANIDTKDSTEKSFSADGVIYKFAGDVVNQFSTVFVGRTYEILTDIFGNVAYVTETATGEILLVLGVANGTSEMDEDISFKALSVSDMKIDMHKLHKNVTINGTFIKNISRDTVKTRLVAGVPVVVRRTSEGNINYIEIPRTKDAFQTSEDGFVTHFGSGSSHYSLMYNIFYNTSYNNIVFYNANTKLLVLPDVLKGATEQDFSIGSFVRRNRQENVAVYSFSKESLYADLVLIHNADYHTQNEVSKFAVVTKVSSTIDEDENQVKKLTYLEDNKEKFCYIQDENIVGTGSGSHSIKAGEITEGDLIVLTVDAKNNLINFQCAYNYNPLTNTGAFSYTQGNPNIWSTTIIYADVLQVKGDFIELKAMYNNNECIFYQPYDGKPITVMTTSNGRCHIKEGNISDVTNQDKIIIVVDSGEMTGALVIK